MTPDIALAASAREWPDRLHRFLLDHGGGRVVDRVMSGDQATDPSFDVLIIDDICSFLTPGVVALVKQRGAEVVGVFAPEDGSDAKRRLLECGISDVIETDATPEEFLSKVNQALAHRTPGSDEVEVSVSMVTIAVTGSNDGVGVTEVAVSLAHALAERASTTIVDLDPRWPSVAQRLDLRPHPNVRTAIDHCLHNPGRLTEAVQQYGELGVIGGRSDAGSGAPLSRHETLAILDGLGRVTEVVVADLGPYGHVPGGLLREFDTTIVVGAAGPIGVTRLIKTIDAVMADEPRLSLLGIVNKVSGGSFERSETMSQLEERYPDLSFRTLPHDRKLADASWNGRLDSGRAHARAIASMADVVVESLA